MSVTYSQPLHILIVEDDDQLSRLYEKFLQHSGYRTLRVNTVQGAIQNLVNFDPDVVCLDWGLGDGTAAPFLNYLMTLEAIYRPKVLITSGRIKPEELAQYQSVVDGYLLKPISIKTLIDRIQTFIPDLAHRERFEAIHHKTLKPQVIYTQWIGAVTPHAIFAKSFPILTEAETVILDIRQLNIDRFQLAGLHELHPSLPHLKNLHVICETNQHTFANFLMQFLTVSTTAQVLYHTDPDRAIQSALSH